MGGFAHTPVLAEAIVEALAVRPGGRYVDGTIGGGGHAAGILTACAPDGWLGGCDRDGAAVKAASSRLTPFASRWEIRQGAFESLVDWIAQGSVDGVLLDLGVSSPQLDLPERGFSFAAEGPLDMRMDDRQELTAAGLVLVLTRASEAVVVLVVLVLMLARVVAADVSGHSPRSPETMQVPKSLSVQSRHAHTLLN